MEKENNMNLNDKIDAYFKLYKDIVSESMGDRYIGHYSLADNRDYYYKISNEILYLYDDKEDLNNDYYSFEINSKAKIVEKNGLVFVLAKADEDYWEDASIFILNKDKEV